MGARNWIVVVLALLASFLVATERAAQLSILILYCLLGFFLVRRLLVAYRRRSNVQHWRFHATQVNDSLYELHKPQGVPTMQVLFFHGLPFGGFSETHLSTWMSGDGSCIWPKVWLAEKFPDAHILVVSHVEGLKNGSAERFDMRIIRENLTSDLIQANIGQLANCPVVLVGHSFGGLVIKDLCLGAHSTLISPRNKAKVQKFLDNLRGVFYYSTPHRGSADIGRASSVLSRRLFKYLTVLSTEAGRLNYDFNRLHNSYPKWQIGGLGEQLPVKMGLFRGIVIVVEASARDGESFNVNSSADHFSICRPENTISRRFTALTTLLHGICHNDEKAIAQKQAVRQNLQHLPKQLINVDGLLAEVKSQLKKYTTLGFVGMGGLGKTTLAKAVFNEQSPKFEYSCFVPDVKLIKGTVEEAKEIVSKHVHRFGRKVGDKDDLSDMIGKGLLLVLDDVSDDRDITLLSHLADNSSPQSRFIVTSRDRMLLRSLDGIYEVPFLDNKDAEKLFLSHAFPKKAVVAPAVERDMVSIVERCGGLPLTLEVIGSYLKLNDDGKFWKQTLRALEKAEAIQDLDTRLWAKLRVSYDGLGDVEKQMFLDATTFFTIISGMNECLTLREAKAAWRETHGTECEGLLWRTLVDRSLVSDVEENERIRVHDQLLSLGQKIAWDCSQNGKCRVWDKTMVSKLRKDDFEEHQDIFALRLDGLWRDDYTGYISSYTLRKLEELQYLAVDVPLIVVGVEARQSFPSNLVLLKCDLGLSNFYLGRQDHLVVLNLSLAGHLPSSIGQLSALRIFIGKGVDSVPDEFGTLSRLEHLEFTEYFNLQSLPDAFGNLPQLQYLKLSFCHRLKFLPETFGGLSNLKELEFEGMIGCPGLHSLPQSFGELSALDHLEFHHCDGLSTLPNSFGNLSALKHLTISHCNQLHGLPDSFGNLLALEELKLSGCHFEALPNSFAKLSTLRHLELSGMKDCENLLSVIPFSQQLTRLQYLKICGNNIWSLIQIQNLPESLAELTALSHLVLGHICIRSIPDFMKSMQSLHTLELNTLPYVKDLPPWLGETGSFPLALSRKMFQVTDGRFRLTSEESSGESLTRPAFIDVQSLVWQLHRNALKKAKESDYQGALEDLCPGNLGVLKPRLQSFLLQERGIARRCTGDLKGALEDLTTALEISSDVDNGHESRYDCFRHRGYVNFLLGDLSGAQDDGADALKLLYAGNTQLWEMSNWEIRKALGGKSVAYMDFILIGRRKFVHQDELMWPVNSEVMEKVTTSDFSGALAIWCAFDASISGYYDRAFFLQERGILRRMVGNLPGALADLTAALDLWVENYDCFKHRGFVKYLMGDEAGARRDAEKCMAMEPKVDVREYLGRLPVAFLEFRFQGAQAIVDLLDESSHDKFVEKVIKGRDFVGALAIWDDFQTRVFGSYYGPFFLQERGILRRMTGDLPGALEDLTAALEVWDNDYGCLKHRGYVKYIMGDKAGARRDAERCLVTGRDEGRNYCLGGLPLAFLEFRFKGGQAIVDLLEQSSHNEVMEKVKENDVVGALAIWEDFQTRVFGSYNSAYFLQERGILRRMTGDLPGALEDLTPALEVWDDEYDCLKHRSYVKFLMGDKSGARTDAERCVAKEREEIDTESDDTSESETDDTSESESDDEFDDGWLKEFQRWYFLDMTYTGTEGQFPNLWTESDDGSDGEYLGGLPVEFLEFELN